MKSRIHLGLLVLFLLADVVVAILWFRQRPGEVQSANLKNGVVSNPNAPVQQSDQKPLEVRSGLKALSRAVRVQAIDAMARGEQDPKPHRDELVDLFTYDNHLSAAIPLLKIGEADIVALILARSLRLRDHREESLPILRTAGASAWPAVLAECDFADILQFLLLWDDTPGVPPLLLQEAALRHPNEIEAFKKRGLSPESVRLFQIAVRAGEILPPTIDRSWQEKCKTLNEFVELLPQKVALALAESEVYYRTSDDRFEERHALVASNKEAVKLAVPEFAGRARAAIIDTYHFRPSNYDVSTAVRSLPLLGPDGAVMLVKVLETGISYYSRAALSGLAMSQSLPSSILPDLKCLLQDTYDKDHKEVLKNALLAAQDLETFRSLADSWQYERINHQHIALFGDKAVPILVEVAENSQHNASRIGWAVGGLRHLHEKGTSVRAALEKLRNSSNDSIAKVARQAFDSIYLTPSDSLPSPPIDRTVVEKQFTDEPNRWRKIDKLRPLIVVDADISFAEKTIVEVWNDPELEKRLVAVNGIGIGAGPKLAKLVAKILRQTHSPRVQVAALETLARIGPRAAAESQVALNALKSSNSWVRHSALDALLRMAVRDTSSRDAFVRALRDPDAGNRGIAILGLEPFEGDALPGLDGLIEMLKDPENQRTTARVIGKIGPGALGPQRLDQLLQLRANHPGLIAESLELIGPQAVPGLLEVLRHPRPIVRSTDPNAMPPHDDRAWALNILGQMRPSVDDPIPTLLEVFRTVDDKTAASVVWVALRQGGRCVPLLREALRHSHADVRRAAVYGCVQLGFAARALLPELRVIVSEKPGTIYDEALLAISKMGPAAVQATEELRANTLHVNHDEVRQFITLFDEDRQRRIWVAFRQFESRYTRQTLRKG